MLAVLTTNHVLSIWECDGKANISANWKRKVIINHSLISHYANVEKVIGETEQQFSERKQVSQRVRDFAWSPITAKPSRDGRHATSPHFLAVSTEAGDLVILHVRSPYDLLAVDSTEWQVEVMRSFKLSELVAEAEFETSMEANNDSFFKDDHKIADHLAWGSWEIVDDTVTCAPLAFIARRKLYTFQVQTESDQSSSRISLWRQTHVKRQIPSRADLSGPLEFTPNTILLTLFAAVAVYCMETSGPLEENSRITSHHLDDRWDEVSGVSFTHTSIQLANIHIVSHLSSSTAVTTALSTPLNHAEVSTPPKWQAAITESKETFSNQYSLDCHVQERTWGVASSPLNDHVATAITLLPSDSIAHVIPSDRHTIVNITKEVPFEDGRIFLTNTETNHISSEVILSHLQRFREQQTGAVELEGVVEMLSQNVEAVPADGESVSESLLLENPDTYSIARHLRAQVLERPDMAKERNITLARLALGLDSHGARLSPQIIQRLISEVMKLDTHLQQGGELSERIRRTYGTLNSKLNRHPQEPQSNEKDESETCRICKEPILFESVKWARCASGHHFSRCALTFLAIQEPGFSKHCGVCGVQVLNEWKIPTLMPRIRDADLEMTDVAMEDCDVLNDGGALDICIYCGGKFIA